MIPAWLKRTFPKGLQARALLILVLPVVTLLLIISVSFAQRHFEGVTRQMTASVLLELRYLIDRVEAQPNLEKAEAEAQSIATPMRFDVAFTREEAPDTDFRRFYDLSSGAVISYLREGLPELRAVHLPTERDVTLWLDLGHGTLQVSFDRLRLSASNPHQLLVMIVVLGALMLGIAWVFLRNQLGPINRLAAAAADFGRGRSVAFQPGGAQEVRAAGMAFLEMRGRIERQTQARTMMLSGVSHDLRTPLTRLRLGLSMLDDSETAPLIRDVDEMQRLLDAFLDFARDEAGDALEEVAPAQLVAEVVEDCRRGGQAVTFLAPPGGIAPVALRSGAIRRAIENLVSNALRYGQTAQVSLARGERSLTISVEDDGPGIPDGQREEAMRPFSRLDPARNQDRGSGVGLGLAIVADIARAHGGTLRLGRSKALGGLKADIVLPL